MTGLEPPSLLLHRAVRHMEEAAMASKRAEAFGAEATLVGLECDSKPGDVNSVKARNVMLSGTVLVDYDITVTSSDGSPVKALVRVVFPDEVRSMLEASSWTRGLTIFDAISQLGATYLERYGVSEARLVSDGPTSESLRLPTFQVPLTYVRSTLASVCALPV